MTAARNLADLLNSSGLVEAAKLAATLDLSSKTLSYPDNSVQSADIVALAASKLSGQVPDANAPSGSVIQVVSISSGVDLNVAGLTGWQKIPSTEKQIISTVANSRFVYVVTIPIEWDSSVPNHIWYALSRNNTRQSGSLTIGNIGEAGAPGQNSTASMTYVDAPNVAAGATLTYAVWQTPSNTASAHYNQPNLGGQPTDLNNLNLSVGFIMEIAP